MKKSFLLLAFLLVMPSFVLFASSAHGEGINMTHRMTMLILQVSLIIVAAWIGGRAAAAIKMPAVLGELLAGIVIGPSLLGALPFPGFPDGFFPHFTGASIPVTPELYGISTIASIILLFLAGLETDIDLFLKYSVKGGIVGVCGVVFSFFSGTVAGMILLKAPLMDPRCLFLGVLSIATSVGITARILSEHRKMDSPEGVTILAAAVIDDVLGIILLAIVLGIVSVMHGAQDVAQTGLPWGKIGIIALKAVAVWLGFTILGLLFARRISMLLKKIGNTTNFTVMAIGLSFLLAGIFESAGLAMIIGAYVLGLTLSNTDINFIIQEKMETLEKFFVPVFFAVMGMLVNLEALFSPKVIIFGLLYSIAAIAAKVIGAGLPSLFMNFNARGALRIGVGMVPRGEVALIIAGIGISNGVLDNELFGIAIMMTLLTTLAAPPLLNVLLASPARGTRSEEKNTTSVETDYSFGSFELTRLVINALLTNFEEENFFAHSIELEDMRVFHFRRDAVFITMRESSNHIVFSTAEEDQAFIKTVVYETMLQLHNTVMRIKDLTKPEDMKHEVIASGNSSTSAPAKKRTLIDWYRYIHVDAISLDLKSKDKESIIKEMIDLHIDSGKLLKIDRDEALNAVMEREKTMTTGMGQGIALPHGRTDTVEDICVAIGISKEGIDFEALDGQPCSIFVLILSPQTHPGPHLQVLSGISTILNSEESRKEIHKISSRSDLIAYMVNHSGK